MEALFVPTQRGPVLAGALFSASGRVDKPARTVVIAITGIHGNFYSNPFYYNVGDTLNAAGIDFVYAQTCDAFGQMRSVDANTEEQVLIGSWNERFSYTVDDVGAWVGYAEHMGYEHVVLAGHSLGANKVIRYLSQTHDPRVDRFLLLSPCNVRHLTSVVTPKEREVVRSMVEQRRGQEMLPFVLLGWIECVANTAHDWLFSSELDNVHVEADADFGQVASIEHEGALLIGTYDTFTYGDPAGFLANINDHFSHPERNRLVFIEGTGHTYQQKEQQMANDVLVKSVTKTGKVSRRLVRSTYLIDEQGVIIRAFGKVKAKDNAQQMLDQLAR